jgi:hypothetical protein
MPDIERAQAAFRHYYVSRGQDRISRRVEYFAAKVGVDVSAVDVRDTGRRCSSWLMPGL